MARFFSKVKDGGPKSNVDAYFLIELKGLFSIALLKFNKGCREEFHSHAFNAWTWFLKGAMAEEFLDGQLEPYERRLAPKVTKKLDVHRVRALRDSWAITVRGPWDPTWLEVNKDTGKTVKFTHGRKEIK